MCKSASERWQRTNLSHRLKSLLLSFFQLGVRMDSTLQDWVPKTPTSAITQGFLLLWVSLVAQTVKNPPAMPETWVRSLGQIPGRSPGEGLGKPLQDSRLRNPMDRGAQWDTVLQRVRHGRAAITFIFFFSLSTSLSTEKKWKYI